MCHISMHTVNKVTKFDLECGWDNGSGVVQCEMHCKYYLKIYVLTMF